MDVETQAAILAYDQVRNHEENPPEKPVKKRPTTKGRKR